MPHAAEIRDSARSRDAASSCEQIVASRLREDGPLPRQTPLHPTPSRPGTLGEALLRLGSLPVACAVVVAIQALYFVLAALGNITDYATNFDFVAHVLSMDTTNFGAPAGEGLDPDVMWRAIEAPWLHHLAYVSVIVWESLTALVLLASARAWIRATRTHDFDRARRLGTLGLSMVLLLFMGGFVTVGGEWFQMWRSVAWNGLDPAFRNTVFALFGLVLMHLPSES